MRSAIRTFLTAVMFMTRIPIPFDLDYSDERLARSTVYFPLVGVIVGGLGAAVFHLTHLLLPIPIAVTLTLATTILATGAFHEDGLADVCDGFGAGFTTEQILTIMKDSRIGTYGGVGLVLMLLARWSALGSLAMDFSIGLVAPALIAGHVLGRWSSLPLIWHYPYVRDVGKSKPFAASVTGSRLAVGSLLTTGILFLGLEWRVAVLTLVVAVLTTALCGTYFRRRIGGITGDCLGAANQLVELSVYLALTAWLAHWAA